VCSSDLLTLVPAVTPLAAETLLCAGVDQLSAAAGSSKPATAPARARTGTRNALVVFARFADSGKAARPPSWAAGFFDPDTPGTFSHFYDTMSQSRLRVRGEVAPGYYTASQPASAYLSHTGDKPGGYGDLVAEILPLVDVDIDFRRLTTTAPTAYRIPETTTVSSTTCS
jgi:hypothetical protein